VCGRMNHCIIGGVGDGYSGEDGGDEQRGARAATAAAAARGTPPLPASWGERRPLAPFLHGFMGALPMEMGSMGEAKTWLSWL
jgi:hypothetical protein